MRVLELFSGTHSIGVVAKELGFDVVSLDRDLDANSKIYKEYTSPHHIKKDILEWDYKKDYNVGEFDIITASPVCCMWSMIRNCWIGRKFKNSSEVVSRQTLDRDMDKFGKPLVDKVFEIIEYFKPTYFWVENPKTSKMWNYIKTKYPQYENNQYLLFDYCKYSDFGYKKPTIFLTNIKITPKICKNDCSNMDTSSKHRETTFNKDYFKNQEGVIIKCDTKLKRKLAKELKWTRHKKNKECVRVGNNRLERYRIPLDLVRELFKKAN
jgi:hypothetical protein